MSGINITVYDGQNVAKYASEAVDAANRAQSAAEMALSEMMDPVLPGTVDGPALIPDGPIGEKRKFEPQPGFYQGFPEVTSDKRWQFYWNGSSWGLLDMGVVPQVQGVDIINPVGDLLTKEKAVAGYVNPIFNVLKIEQEYKFPIGESVDVTLATIQNNGDYLEFDSRLESNLNLLRMFGTNASTTNSFGFYFGVLRLRGSVANEEWIEFTDLPSLFAYHKYKLVVRVDETGSFWDLYIDDVLFSSKPKVSNFSINNIGKSYLASSGTDAPFYFRNKVSIHVGGVTTDYSNFQTMNPLVERITQSEVLSKNVNYPEMFVSFDPVGSGGRHLFTVYIKKNINKYIGINIIRQGTPDTNTNLFRINRGWEYTYDGNMMARGGEVITEGESEFTLMTADWPEHTGGAHGNEVYDLFKFFMDGVEVDLSTAFVLKPCKTSYYIQKSTILHYDTKMPIVSHLKRTDFGGSSYKTYNKVVGLITPTLPMAYVYTGIVCIGEYAAVKAIDDNFNEAPVTIADGIVLDNTGEYLLNYLSNSMGVEVTSRSITAPEPRSRMYVQARPIVNDCKYYRTNNIFNKNNPSDTPINLNAGESWEVECTVKFQ